MQQENIRYVLVWSTWLRLSHWLIAAGTLFQITSAWALKHGSADYTFWLDWHLITGQVVLMALVLRLVLFFFPGSSHWRTFIPEQVQRRAMLQMIKFYLSFARFPLPNWYAHNPLWLPLYPIMYLLLAATAASGLLYDSSHLFMRYSVHELHRILASWITVFILFHVISVVLHELKGKGAFISAMINGYRYFHSTDRDDDIARLSQNNKTGKKSVSISVDSITKQSKDQ